MKPISEKNEMVYIALGSNLKNPLQQLDIAALSIGIHESITLVGMSKVYRTKPHGTIAQNDFFNAILEISTTLSADELLSFLQGIEIEQGRDRSENAQHWGPRIIDLDIVLFKDVILNTKRLTIPHPLAHEREFVVQPLLDLSPELEIPGQGRVIDLAKKLPINTMEVIRDVTTFNH